MSTPPEPKDSSGASCTSPISTMIGQRPVASDTGSDNAIATTSFEPTSAFGRKPRTSTVGATKSSVRSGQQPLSKAATHSSEQIKLAPSNGNGSGPERSPAAEGGT